MIVGTSGAIGTSDLLACFAAGCALNWDGQFLSESIQRHDEVNSCIDTILNLGGFMYIGTVLPSDEFHDPNGTGITYPRLIALGILGLLLRRIPALLLTYTIMSWVIKNWREALFMGYFGPTGVGAVCYLQSTRHVYFNPELEDEEGQKLLNALSPGKKLLMEQGLDTIHEPTNNDSLGQLSTFWCSFL